MKFYNPISKKYEPFKKSSSTATIYVCGITPYDTTHLGHAFTYTTADILIRYLENQKRLGRIGKNWEISGQLILSMT